MTQRFTYSAQHPGIRALQDLEVYLRRGGLEPELVRTPFYSECERAALA